MLTRGAGGSETEGMERRCHGPRLPLGSRRRAARRRGDGALLLALVALVRTIPAPRGRSGLRRTVGGAPSRVLSVHRAGRGSERTRGFRDDVVSPGPNVVSTSSILRNAPGPIPGLSSTSTPSRAPPSSGWCLCNRAYWPFLRVALQSARASADIVPYWTVLVPDEGAAEFVRQGVGRGRVRGRRPAEHRRRERGKV